MTRNLLGLLVLSSVLLLVSWSYLIVGSNDQYGELGLTSDTLDENGSVIPDAALFPKATPGLAHQGSEVYVSLGCIACHTQQVRLEGVGNDLKRGWGLRPSMPRDYVRQSQPLLGRFRHGPDLANAGTRKELTEEALHRRLYSPQIEFPDSTCQPNPFLYDRRKIQGDVSEGAYDLQDGTEIIPGRAARKLVAYLSSLRQDYELPEMPFLIEPEIVIRPVSLLVPPSSTSENNGSSDE
jgi:cytochrome c oxidase cbb3-type subunit 2